MQDAYQSTLACLAAAGAVIRKREADDSGDGSAIFYDDKGHFELLESGLARRHVTVVTGRTHFFHRGFWAGYLVTENSTEHQLANASVQWLIGGLSISQMELQLGMQEGSRPFGVDKETWIQLIEKPELEPNELVHQRWIWIEENLEQFDKGLRKGIRPIVELALNSRLRLLFPVFSLNTLGFSLNTVYPFYCNTTPRIKPISEAYSYQVLSWQNRSHSHLLGTVDAAGAIELAVENLSQIIRIVHGTADQFSDCEDRW